jgi:hypothetical protein
MTEISQSIRAEGVVRRYDYGAESLVVADLGHVEGTVDLVDGTAIVVADGDQAEFDVPEGASRAFMTNGVVTVEVED